MTPSGLVVGLGVAVAVWAVAASGRGDAARVRHRVLEGTRVVAPDGPAGVAPTVVVDRVAASAVLGALRVLGRSARRVMRRPRAPTLELPTGLALLMGTALALLAGPVVGVATAVGSIAASWWWERRRPLRREAEVRAVLPDVVDLFRLAVGAGLSLHQAIEVVAPRAPEPVGGVLQDVRRQVGLGVRLGDALVVLEDLGDSARSLQSALTAAARYGAPLTASLDRVATEARMLRRRRAEERARTLPVKLLFPLVMCVLPAFGLLAVVPLLAGSLPSLVAGP